MQMPVFAVITPGILSEASGSPHVTQRSLLCQGKQLVKVLEEEEARKCRHLPGT